MTKVSELHQKWMKESAYRDDYEKLGAEFEFARALIEARVQAGLTQAELAKRMKTTESVVARMGRWACEAFDSDAGALCSGYGYTIKDQLRTR